MSATTYLQRLRFADAPLIATDLSGVIAITHQIHRLDVTGAKGDPLDEISTPSPQAGDELVLLHTLGSSLFISNFGGASGNISTPNSFGFTTKPGDVVRFVYTTGGFFPGAWKLSGISRASDYEQLESIDTGEITGEAGHILRLLSEGGDDDLDTINAPIAGREIVLRNDTGAGGLITLTTTGNIVTPDGQSITLATDDFAVLRADGTNWHVIAYSLTDVRGNPRSPRVQYARVLFSDLAAGVSDAASLGIALPAGAEVIDVITRVVLSGVSGSGDTTDVEVTTGVSSDPNAYHGIISGFLAPGRYFGPRGLWATGDGAQPVAEFTATGPSPDLSDLTAGAWDFYVVFMVLPDVT